MSSSRSGDVVELMSTQAIECQMLLYLLSVQYIFMMITGVLDDVVLVVLQASLSERAAERET